MIPHLPGFVSLWSLELAALSMELVKAWILSVTSKLSVFRVFGAGFTASLLAPAVNLQGHRPLFVPTHACAPVLLKLLPSCQDIWGT